MVLDLANNRVRIVVTAALFLLAFSRTHVVSTRVSGENLLSLGHQNAYL